MPEWWEAGAGASRPPGGRRGPTPRVPPPLPPGPEPEPAPEAEPEAAAEEEERPGPSGRPAGGGAGSAFAAWGRPVSAAKVAAAAGSRLRASSVALRGQGPGLRALVEGRLEARTPGPGVNYSRADGHLDAAGHLPLLASRYKVLRALGAGASAQVLLAEDTWHPRKPEVTIKVLRRDLREAGAHEARVLRLLNARDAADSCHVVRLLDAFAFAGHACLVLERLHGDLLNFLAAAGRRDPAELLGQVRKIASQLVACLGLCEAAGVVHADLKPENVLFCRPGGAAGGAGGVRVKVIDFGNAVLLEPGAPPVVDPELQSLPYRAPEVALGRAAGCGIDAWSVGCVLAEVLLMRPLLPCSGPDELLERIAAVTGAGGPAARGAREGPTLHEALMQRYADRDAASFVLELLESRPEARVRPLQARLHPFFSPLYPFRAGVGGLGPGGAERALDAAELARVRRFKSLPAAEADVVRDPRASGEGLALCARLRQERRGAKREAKREAKQEAKRGREAAGRGARTCLPECPSPEPAGPPAAAMAGAGPRARGAGYETEDGLASMRARAGANTKAEIKKRLEDLSQKRKQKEEGGEDDGGGRGRRKSGKAWWMA